MGPEGQIVVWPECGLIAQHAGLMIRTSFGGVRRQLFFPLPLPHPGILPNYGFRNCRLTAPV
jgi:hypothetical protein